MKKYKDIDFYRRIKSVNRTQFFYLLCSFMKEFSLAERWHKESITYKVGKGVYEHPRLYDSFTENESIGRHLLKCIDIYIDKTANTNLYYGTISGFFSYIPSSFNSLDNCTWTSFWVRYSKIWKERTVHIKIR